MVREITKEKKTVMYSVEEFKVKNPSGARFEKRVVRHVLPFDAQDPIGMQKLQKYMARGYTFEDPRKRDVPILEEVHPAKVVESVKVEPVSIEMSELNPPGPPLMIPCPEPGCGKLCKGAFGLEVHSKIHVPGYTKKRYKK